MGIARWFIDDWIDDLILLAISSYAPILTDFYEVTAHVEQAPAIGELCSTSLWAIQTVRIKHNVIAQHARAVSKEIRRCSARTAGVLPLSFGRKTEAGGCL